MAEGKFNPTEHLRSLRGKDYLDVKWRLVWFHSDTGSKAGYVTVELEHDRQAGYARYAAIAWDGKDDEWRTMKFYDLEVQVCGRVGTGIKSETKSDFPEYDAKAETGALGRALAGISYGTQFAPDIEEGERIVDSPVERKQQPQQPRLQTVEKPAQDGPVNEAQRNRIKELSGHLKRSEPDYAGLTFQGASMLIRQLQADWTEAQAKQAQAEKDSQPATAEQLASIRKLCAALGREEPDPQALTFTSAGAFIRQLSKDYNQRRQQGNQSA